MLVPGPDVLELDADGLHEAGGLARTNGVVGWEAERAIDECDAHTALFEGLSDRGLVGQLAGINVAAGRQPEAELAVTVKQDASVVDDEDGDGELARDAGRRGLRRRRRMRQRCFSLLARRGAT